MQVCLNGRFVPLKDAGVSIMDHGFLYGDGVYETIRVYNARPFFLREHLRRLAHSMKGIHLPPPFSFRQLEESIAKVIALNRHHESVVRVIVTRGPGPYGFDTRQCISPTWVVTSTPFGGYPAEYYRDGMTVAVVSVVRNDPGALPPSVKYTSCLNGILAKIEATRMRANEALMLDRHGYLAEGSVSNAFLVRKNVVYTPALTGELLPGVTRGFVIKLARKMGYRVLETKVTCRQLLAADEIFLTNTLMEIMPVGRLAFAKNLKPKGPSKIGWITAAKASKKRSHFSGSVTSHLIGQYKRALA